MTTTWLSTVPGAIAAIVAAFGASPDLAGVEVLDGPQVKASSSKEAVVVGFTGERMSLTGAYPEPTENAVSVRVDDAGLAGIPQLEQYSVHCMAAVLNGGGNIAAARSRAYELIAAAGSALAADPRLGGAVMRARIGSTGALSQDQTPKGAIATVTFDVDCDAFTGR